MPDDTYGEVILYYDSIPHMDVIENTRQYYEWMAPVFLKPESYLSIFYNGYDDTDKMFMYYLIVLKRVKMHLIF